MKGEYEFWMFFGAKNGILDRQRRAKDRHKDGPLRVVNAKLFVFTTHSGPFGGLFGTCWTASGPISERLLIVFIDFVSFFGPTKIDKRD